MDAKVATVQPRSETSVASLRVASGFVQIGLYRASVEHQNFMVTCDHGRILIFPIFANLNKRLCSGRNYNEIKLRSKKDTTIFCYHL